VQRFQRTVVTAEDRERTLLYRRRVATLPPRESSAADIRGFLVNLEMQLVIEDRTTGDRSRAIQLINKTNQFNVNGLRLDDAEVERQLASGSRLFTAALSDRSGDHGQILAAILAPDGTLTSMVMSCRVFQRRIEYAFLAWLSTTGLAPKAVAFRGTERNAPARNFLESCTGSAVKDGLVALAQEQMSAFSNDLTLFTLKTPVIHP
jgi:FkbH-like protein